LCFDLASVPFYYSVFIPLIYRKLQILSINVFQSAFNKSLSQKVRHIRHALKCKSKHLDINDSAERAPKKQCFRQLAFSGATNDNVVSETDVERHVEELKSQWTKPNPSALHIKALLRNTRQDRVELLTKTPSGSISPIFKRYPCFADSIYVSICYLFFLNCTI
jgi:hypothetical protein